MPSDSSFILPPSSFHLNLSRFNIYGDFWLRALRQGARSCPWYLEPVFIGGCTVLFFVVLKKTRNAVASNLRIIHPGASRWMSQLRVLRVFWNFAWTLADLMHVRLGEEVISWEIVGKEYLEALENSTAGSILLTAHMGNYDVAAPIFAPCFKQKIHMVRTPERQRESQEFHQQKRQEEQSSTFVIHYNEPGNMLGVELARCLGEGDVVAIQGDRILFDVSPMTVNFREGITWNLPRGPFMLGMVAKAAIYPVFIIRMGYRRYRIEAFPAIEMSQHREGREAAQKEAAQRWSEVLASMVVKHWRQWFVFEPVFGEQVSASQSSGETTASPEETKPCLEIKANHQRTAGPVFTASTGFGLWSLLMMIQWLGSWQPLNTFTQIMAWLCLPLLWFLMWVLVLMLFILVSLVSMKLFRLSEQASEFISTALLLMGGSWLALNTLHSASMPWLGWAWFAGLAVFAVRAVQTKYGLNPVR